MTSALTRMCHTTLTERVTFSIFVMGFEIKTWWKVKSLSFRPHDAKTKKGQAKMAKREKVSCGRVLAWACVASASRSLELLQRKIALKFNFRYLKLHRAIVMLNTAPPAPSPRLEGRVLPYVDYTGVCR